MAIRQAELAADARSRSSIPATAPVSLDAVSGLLRGLNREQRRAIVHREGPLLVVAGPGTGKTEVVTRRVAWLIATKRARPREILALTFTDNAAAEMQARVDVLVPYGQADASIHTFHALGDRMLREFAFEIGLPGDLRLVNRPEAITLLRDHLFELGLERYRPLGDPTRFLGAIVELFGRAKDEDISPAALAAHAAKLCAGAAGLPDDEAAGLRDLGAARAELATAYERYQALLAARGLIDHGDQVALALRLLRDRPAVRAAVESRYRYLLVDEFQDTNTSQLELALALTGGARNVTVVGDADQAIYTFRGAAAANLARFQAAHPDLRRVVLRRNYRSRTPILEASRRLIRNNLAAEAGAVLSGTAGPVAHRRSRNPLPVRALVFGSPDEEADGVADRIAQRVAAGSRPRDFAVLVRTNAEADSLRRSLQVRGVPVRASTRTSLLDEPAARTLLAFLRVVADPTASPELYLLAGGEPYGLAGDDLTVLLQHARRRHRPLWDVMTAVVDGLPASPELSPAGRQAAGRLADHVRAGIALAPLRTSGEVLYDFLRRSGRLAQLAAASADGQDGAALRSVVRFFELVRARASLLGEDRVAFLVPLLDALDEAAADDPAAGPDQPDAVSVLTVHRAKGLEFRIVYLAGLVEGRFPLRARPPALSLPEELLTGGDVPGDEQHLAEERRLCYVAMTRARDELWLSYHTAGPAGRGRRRPSPFVAEALDGPAVAVEAPAPSAGLLTPGRQPVEEGAPAGDPMTGPLSLSYSQLDDYLACPERFRLRHVAGVPTPAHHALAYGSALHQAVAAFHLRRGEGVTMSENELLAACAAVWSPEGFLSREHEEARYAAGQAALRRFREQQLLAPANVVAIERPFVFHVGADRVRGRMDRIDSTPRGAVIVDYKSSDVRDQRRADEKARDSLQLQIYALAHAAETGELPHEVQLHFLDSGVVGRAGPDRGRLERAQAKIATAADGIRAGYFRAKPNPVACGYCPYRQICPSSAA
jgi:DNA helicase-2/ATP-dependent DNA helicase PcrA